MTAIQASSIRQTNPVRDSKSNRVYDIEWWVVLIWVLHFTCTVGVILLASFDNGGTRKFISVDARKLSLGCSRAFLNVLDEDPDNAVFCCGQEHEFSNSILCKHPPSYMLFARRLARLPDAILIPLFPIIIQFIEGVYYYFYPENTTGGRRLDEQSGVKTKRRFQLYVGLILFRMFILYWLMDNMENILVPYDPNAVCWYQELTRGRSINCPGRNSDFSDHIVLYFAQLLPMALMEAVHYFERMDRSSMVTSYVMVGGMIHIYAITCYNAYKTASYFHTGPEILAGYLVSLIVQIPLCILQTTNLWPGLRRYFVG